MSDYYLKLSSETELKNVLVQAELATETEDGFSVVDGVALDIIGEIPDVKGFHANLRVTKELEARQDIELIKYSIDVATPMRVWA